MKTLEQLFEEIKASEELKNKLAEAMQGETLDSIKAFLKENGCDATIDEAKAFIAEKLAEMKESGELTPDQLEQVAGGTATIGELTIVLTFIGATLGLGFGGGAIVAACSDD